MARLARRRLGIAVAAALLVSGSALALVLTSSTDSEPSLPDGPSVPSVLRLEGSGLRYTFHILSGQEALFDATADPGELRNLARERPEDARRLREELERQYGVESLEELRERRREEIEQLKSLGYL